MAIKPNDCIIRIHDLRTGTKMVPDIYGRDMEVPQYEKFWENFSEHVFELSKKVDTKNWRDWKTTPHSMVYAQELKKFGAVHKETKDYRDCYIKFKSHGHLTLFVMKFS